MSIEDKYKPFWETEDNETSQSRPSERDTLKQNVSGTTDGQDTIIKINTSEQQANSFMDYLAKERMQKKIRVEQIDDSEDEDEVFDDQDNLNEDTTEDYSGTYSKPFPFFETFITILLIGGLIYIGYIIFNSVQSQAFTQLNTTAWSENTTTPLTAIGGTIQNQFSFLNPFLTILMVGIALMIITRHRSIAPFMITFIMAISAIIIFDASWLVILIPGTLLIFKTMRGMGSLA